MSKFGRMLQYLAKIGVRGEDLVIQFSVDTIPVCDRRTDRHGNRDYYSTLHADAL